MSIDASAVAGPVLHLAGRYRRELKASVSRVWENVFDWEHLPSLHETTFARVELIDSHPRGNRLRLISPSGDPDKSQVVELLADVESGRYVVTTREGPGSGSEIRTHLTPLGLDATLVEVEFHVPEARPERLATLAARYQEIYARLWDEDEEMMTVREAALRRRRDRRDLTAGAPIDLGETTEVFARLPMMVEFGGERFRLISHDGALICHAADCPHWLGPLDDAAVVNGCIRCPWHGYLFDILSGLSRDGRELRLARPPTVRIDSGRVELHPPAAQGYAPR